MACSRHSTRTTISPRAAWRSVRLAPLLAALAGIGLPAGDMTLADAVRAQAVVNLTFDEPSGDAVDTAVAGTAKDNGVLANGPRRVRSPFWGQSGRQALLLDAAAKQYVQIADGPDLDRPDAVSLSLFFINLHPAGDGAFHGLFGKRDGGGNNSTNYGVNYAANNDTFQVYLNDGTGFKTGTWSVQAAVGFRRPTFVTAVYQVGDAPAPDADEDRDDVLVRFYANGQPVVPKGATGGFVSGSDVWLTDIKVAGLLNDVPFTLGSSFPGGEPASAVIDEFSVFPKALSAEEAAALFVEVAGANAAALAADEARPLAGGPEISALSQAGVQGGQTTLLAVTGGNLLPAPQLVVPFLADKVSARPGATAERAEFDVPVPATVATGHYPLRVQTPAGVSGTLTLAVDGLPQSAYVEGSPDRPAPLPAAISGTLTGQQQHRVYFAGKTGDRIVIDLECKRLGALMDPVLELRNPRGAPLAIAWGKPQYRGDTRIEATLFADGVHSVDLHDLAYNAPGANAYRLKIGNLKLVDSTFPPAVPRGAQQSVEAIGPGMNPAVTLPVDMQNTLPGIPQTVNLPPEMGVVGPAPAVVVSESVEILEAAQPEGQVQAVDARFPERTHVPVVVNGRIARPAESDRYLLQTSPGMTLSFSAESHSLRSPLDAQIQVLSAEGTVLAASEERPAVEFAVPAGVTSVQVALRDLNRRGGPEYLYRLRIVPSGQPDFSLALDSGRIVLGRDGSALVRLDVNRAGYAGPIALSLAGAPDLTIVPDVLPPGATKALVQLVARNADTSPEALVRQVRLIGQSAGLEPPLRRLALAPFDSRLSLVPAQRAELTVTLLPAAGARVAITAPPMALFKGTAPSLPVSVQFADPRLAAGAVRLTLVTTEATRTRVDPTDPTQQRRIPLPLVRSQPEQTLVPGETAGVLSLAVPLDVAEPQLDCIVRAEFVPHAFSDKVLSTVYSAPFRLDVRNAAAVQLAASALALSSKAQTKFTGTLKRAAGYAEPINLALVNLPAGYAAPPVTVPPGEEQFEIVVTAPEITAAADLPNIQFRVTTPAGAPLQADVGVPTKAMP